MEKQCSQTHAEGQWSQRKDGPAMTISEVTPNTQLMLYACAGNRPLIESHCSMPWGAVGGQWQVIMLLSSTV